MEKKAKRTSAVVTAAKGESVVVTEAQTPKRKKSKEAKESAVVSKTGKRLERTWTPPTPTWPPHSQTQTKRKDKSEAVGEAASRSWRASSWWTPCT
jgi:hypothetical protein